MIMIAMIKQCSEQLQRFFTSHFMILQRGKKRNLRTTTETCLWWVTSTSCLYRWQEKFIKYSVFYFCVFYICRCAWSLCLLSASASQPWWACSTPCKLMQQSFDFKFLIHNQKVGDTQVDWEKLFLHGIKKKINTNVEVPRFTFVL